MDGYADGLDEIDRFFSLDMASSSNGMATDAMQSTHETADSTQTAIQDPFEGTMDSSDNLALDWGHANHEFSPATQTLLPDLTVAPYEMKNPSTYNHTDTQEPVAFLSYNPDFDGAGDDLFSRHYAPGSHAPGPLYDLDAQDTHSEQLENFGGFERQLGNFAPGGISAPMAPSPSVHQFE